MKHFAKRSLSVFLAVLMLASICVIPASADNAGKENGIYYFLGDSMSFNFVRKNNYLASDYMKTYPEQVAEHFGYYMTEDCRLPGGRITDAYSMMSDYEGDDYFIQHFGGDNKQEYTDRISEADVLTIQLGYSGLSIYELDNFGAILGGDGLKYSADLDQVFTPSELEKIMPFVSKAQKLAESMIDPETKAAFNKFINELSENEKEAIKAVLGEEIIDTLTGAGDTVGALIDVVTYLLVAHCVHFDRTIERIYELNPDVELFVMGMMNPVEQITLGFDVLDKTYTLPVGKLLGVSFDIMNSYMKVFSPMSTQYYFVDNLRHLETFGELMARDVDVTRDLLYANYNNHDKPGGGWDNHQYKNAEAFAKADAQAKGVSQAIANTQCINLSKALADLPSDLSSISLSTDESALAKLTEFDENDNLTASYLDQLMADVCMLGILKGIYVHPTQAGHDAETPLLIAAMENPRIDPLAIAYHHLAAPAETMIKALDESDCIDDFLTWKDSIEQIWKEEQRDAAEPETPAEPETTEETEAPTVPETPTEPKTPTAKPSVITKAAAVVKNIVKSVNVTVNAAFTKLGKLFK